MTYFVFVAVLRVAIASVAGADLTPATQDECAHVVAFGAVTHRASVRDALVQIRRFRGESNCQDDVVNPDSGACGRGQFLGAGRRGYGCAELRDPFLASEVWFRDLDDARAACGSTYGALCVLSTGRCDCVAGGRDWSWIVHARCASTRGLTDRCELVSPPL